MSNGNRFYDMAAKSESAAARRSASHSMGKGADGFDGALAEDIMPPSSPENKGAAQYQLSRDEAR